MSFRSHQRSERRERRKERNKRIFVALSVALILYLVWMLHAGRPRPPVMTPDVTGVRTVGMPSPVEAAQDQGPAQRVIADYPGEPDLWGLAAEELLPTDPASARELFAEALDAAGEFPSPYLLENAALAALAMGDARQAAEFVARMPASLAQDPQVRILRGAAKIGHGEAPEVPAEATGDADVYVRDGSRLLAPSRLPVESAIAGCERLAGTAGPFQQAACRLLARAPWHADAQDAASQAQRAAAGSKSLSDWRFLDGALKRARMDTAACESTMAGLASSSVEAALEYTGWLLVRHQAGAAQAWLAALPSELAKDNRLADRRALVLLAAGDETGFQAAITGGAWGRIAADSADFAFSARLADLRKKAGLRAELWAKTLLTCGRDGQSLRVLNRLAMDWGWKDETSSSFRALLAGGAGPAEARRYLAWARRRGDSALVEEAALALRTALPADEEANALWVRIALLREDGASGAEAAAIAARLASRDTAYVPLLALALRRQGRDDEAIAALEKLAPELLMQPRTALYYAFLIASVEPARAGRYLDYAARGVDFLPEEKLMLSQARATTNARGDLSTP